MMKGLPLAYNSDMQEDKEPFFDSVDTLEAILGVLPPMLGLAHLPHRAHARRGRRELLDRDRPRRLPRAQGLPFRDAPRGRGQGRAPRARARRHAWSSSPSTSSGASPPDRPPTSTRRSPSRPPCARASSAAPRPRRCAARARSGPRADRGMTRTGRRAPALAAGRAGARHRSPAARARRLRKRGPPVAPERRVPRRERPPGRCRREARRADVDRAAPPRRQHAPDRSGGPRLPREDGGQGGPARRCSCRRLSDVAGVPGTRRSPSSARRSRADRCRAATSLHRPQPHARSPLHLRRHRHRRAGSDQRAVAPARASPSPPRPERRRGVRGRARRPRGAPELDAPAELTDGTPVAGRLIYEVLGDAPGAPVAAPRPRARHRPARTSTGGLENDVSYHYAVRCAARTRRAPQSGPSSARVAATPPTPRRRAGHRPGGGRSPGRPSASRGRRARTPTWPATSSTGAAAGRGHVGSARAPADDLHRPRRAPGRPTATRSPPRTARARQRERPLARRPRHRSLTAPVALIHTGNHATVPATFRPRDRAA